MMPVLDGLEVCQRRARAAPVRHHADRRVRRDRHDRRARARRRRLHHQAVLGARVPQPRQGGAAARAITREEAVAGRGDADPRLRSTRAARLSVRGGDVPLIRRVRDPRLARAPPGRVWTRDQLLDRRLGRQLIPRSADRRRPHPPPAREDRDRPARSRVHLHRSRCRLPLPRPRASLLGRSSREHTCKPPRADLHADHARRDRDRLHRRRAEPAIEPDQRARATLALIRRSATRPCRARDHLAASRSASSTRSCATPPTRPMHA